MCDRDWRLGNPVYDDLRYEANPYPSKPCTDHPSRMWEWDGYGWVCAGCVLRDPAE